MRTKWSLAVLLGVFLVAFARSAGIAQDFGPQQDLRRAIEDDSRFHEFSQSEVARIIRGFQIAPVPLRLRGANLPLVGLGSYLVNATGGCNDCHTLPAYADGGDPFLGQPKKVNAARYLAGGTPFGDPGDPNTPFSRNLTPDASTGLPAGLTWQQFRQTLRTGIDLKNLRPFAPSEEHDLLQVMPWPVYQDLTDRDLRAIYEYLRTIPSLPSTPQ